MGTSWLFAAAILLITAGLYLLSLRFKPLARLYSPLGLSLAAGLLLVACLLMGLIRQQDEISGTEIWSRIGLRSLKDSAFLTGIVLLCTVLCGMYAISAFRNSRRRLAFLVPTGIFVCIVELLLGSYSLERYPVTLWKGNPVWTVYDRNRQEKKLPFALEITEFRIDYHNPALYVVDRTTGQPLPLKNPESIQVDAGQYRDYLDGKAPMQEGNIAGWHIRILEYLPQAWNLLVDGRFVCIPSSREGNNPAVRVDVRKVSWKKERGFDKPSRQEDRPFRSGNREPAPDDSSGVWISSGTVLLNPAFAELDDRYLLCMAKLKPENYTVGIKLYKMTDAGAGQIVWDSIRPNRPIRVGHYQIYLKSYKEDYGFWDPYVELEIVRDPWAPAVYAGIALLLIGLLAGLWPAKRKRGPENPDLDRNDRFQDSDASQRADCSIYGNRAVCTVSEPDKNTDNAAMCRPKPEESACHGCTADCGIRTEK